MTDRISTERRSWNMSRIKGKDTKPELLLRSSLHKAGFRFRTHDRRLPGKPDLVLRKFKSVIFVNGCFWHRHEGCQKSTIPKSNAEFWKKKFSDTIERDARKLSQLEADGWHVFTVWECEIKRDIESVISSLTDQLDGGQ